MVLSKFRVGCALLAEKVVVIKGVNVETAPYRRYVPLRKSVGVNETVRVVPYTQSAQRS